MEELEELVEAGGNGAEDGGELFALVRREFAEDKIDVAHLGAELRVVGANAKTRKIFGSQFGDDGFEAVIATGRAAIAVAELAEVEIEVITDGEEIVVRDFIVVLEGFDGLAGDIIEALRFDKNHIFARS